MGATPPREWNPPVTGALPLALGQLREAMAVLGRPWMVIGGIAVIAHGVPRATIDVDATILATGTTPDTVMAALAGHGFAPRVADAVAFARQHQVLLVVHTESGVPIDITFAWMPFEEEALGRANQKDFAGSVLPVISVDDLIVYKLVASRPRDIDDVERLLAAYSASVEHDRITRLLADFCTLLEDSTRIETWERLVRARHD